MSTDDRVQSVRNAWTNALRAEVLRVGRAIPEVARVAAVGMWIATYADADGSNAFPGRDTLAALCGCSQETVTRAVKVLMGVGVLTRRRRPNASAMYQLLIPRAGGLDWAEHIHHMTDTRQRLARRREKEQLAAELSRKASADMVRTASADGVPDSVRVGGSEPVPDGPEGVRGRPRKASADAVRTASASGVYQYIPTYGRDPLPDHDMADDSPQPQLRAGEAAEDESSPGEPPPSGEPEPPATGLNRCRQCLIPLIRPGRDLCHGCEPAPTGDERRSA
ncbi:helix-turn-helix domain-containing protein [Streptomyces sp. MMS24-I2-30]|uniref:helix-turn-helix domain-containing protein n=1 Tax=Streptomyces sp. MMS24-I2-30 TaxID=3351564 RepID=UPI00389688A9